MADSRSPSLFASSATTLRAQRLYFRVVQGTVVIVLALQLALKLAYGSRAVLPVPVLTVYAALILLSWYGGSGTAYDFREARKPWGLLFGFIALLIVVLCAESGGVASPYLLLLFITCGFAALTLPPDGAIVLTAIVSVTYGATAWLYHGAPRGLLSGGIQDLQARLADLPQLNPHALSALVVQLGFFWLATVVAARLAAGFRERVDRAESVALLDPLTTLPNRRGFMQKLRVEAERVAQWDWRIAMLLIDLDHFKLVNDRFDHKVGDLALVHTARILREVAGPLDHVARLGGEEFVVAAVGSDRQHAEDLAQRINRAFRRHDWTTIAPGLGPVTCSIGIALRNPSDTPDRFVDFEAMIQDADHALLTRKRHGRDGYFMAGEKVPLKDRDGPSVLKRPDGDAPLTKARFIRR